MKRSGLKAGSLAKVSGQFEETGPRGGLQGNEATVVKGKRLPPTDKGNSWTLVDVTKHKR